MNHVSQLVSVVICTHNRAGFLPKCLESIVAQTYANIEIIIINDASSDHTELVLNSYDFGTIPHTILTNQQNLGLQYSLNLGLSQCTGQFISRIDDDDEWIDKEKLQKQIDVFNKDARVVLVGTGFLKNGVHERNPLLDSEIRKQILFRCPFQHSTVMFRRIVNHEVVMYDDGLLFSEDWDLWLRLGKLGQFVNLADQTTLIATGNNISEASYVIQHVGNSKLAKKYLQDYPNKFKAIIYHFFVVLYFKIGLYKLPIHNLSQKLFNLLFSSR